MFIVLSECRNDYIHCLKGGKRHFKTCRFRFYFRANAECDYISKMYPVTFKTCRLFKYQKVSERNANLVQIGGNYG